MFTLAYKVNCTCFWLCWQKQPREDRTHREMKCGIQLILFILFSPRPSFSLALPTSMNPIYKIQHNQAHQLISYVVLDHVILTIMTNHRTTRQTYGEWLTTGRRWEGVLWADILTASVWSKRTEWFNTESKQTMQIGTLNNIEYQKVISKKS